MEKLAAAFGLEVRFSHSGFDPSLEKVRVAEAMSWKPDLLILLPASAKGGEALAASIHQARMPLLYSNTMRDQSCFRCRLAWTGPDDWAQSRVNARAFAEGLGVKGGYALAQHVPGTSPFYARSYAVVTELAKAAPNLHLLEAGHGGFDRKRTSDLVGTWLAKHGDALRGIYSADDADTALGIADALERPGRGDIVVSAAGASAIGLDLVGKGILHPITYQSAEGDGALALKAAVDWFSGLELEPLVYLPYEVITRENLSSFLPTQW